MSDWFWIIALLITPSILVGISNIIIALKTSTKIDTVHTLINSKMDKLLTTTKKLGHLEGKETERIEEIERHNLTENLE